MCKEKCRIFPSFFAPKKKRFYPLFLTPISPAKEESTERHGEERNDDDDDDDDENNNTDEDADDGAKSDV